MASQIKDFFESFASKDGQKGFVTALLIVITILTTYSWVWSIQFQTAQNDIWVRASTTAASLGFPSYQNQEYSFLITGISEHAGSVNVSVHQSNGYQYSGTFYRGDTVSFGNWKVQIEEINLDRSEPVHLLYTTYSDGKPLLTIAFIILLVIALTSWGTKSRKKSEKPRKTPKDELEQQKPRDGV